MEILLADSLGFCMGVKRAVDLAYRARERSGGLPIVTLGPLIHNTQETERLARDGISAVDPEQPPDSGMVLIRAHGVAPQAYEQLRARGLKVFDGTCPYVHYSQRKAVELRREGYEVVIVGDRNHPEIRGILGYIEDDAFVVRNEEEARLLPEFERLGIIAQTTLSPEKYASVCEVLRGRALEVKVCETICDATEENQAAVRELAGRVDLVFVIGGRHSANSNKLVDAARSAGARAILIETPEEIAAADLERVARVGVSAGASTPDWIIARVVAELHQVAQRKERANAEYTE
jgi:(E)-4-hydroxy-3-methyl-but-2-enyl pyrophosphate reductase